MPAHMLPFQNILCEGTLYPSVVLQVFYQLTGTCSSRRADGDCVRVKLDFPSGWQLAAWALTLLPQLCWAERNSEQSRQLLVP